MAETHKPQVATEIGSEDDDFMARNKFFSDIRHKYCWPIIYKEMVKGSLITGTIGSAGLWWLEKTRWYGKNINWRFKVFLHISAWTAGIYMWGESFALRCATGHHDWMLMRKYTEETGLQPKYHPGTESDEDVYG